MRNPRARLQVDYMPLAMPADTRWWRHELARATAAELSFDSRWRGPTSSGDGSSWTRTWASGEMLSLVITPVLTPEQLATSAPPSAELGPFLGRVCTDMRRSALVCLGAHLLQASGFYHGDAQPALSPGQAHPDPPVSSPTDLSFQAAWVLETRDAPARVDR